jgi:membrane protease YdiL (CAAX protease family)
MEVGIERKVLVSRAFLLLFTGFAVAEVYDLVMSGGNLADIAIGAETTSLLLGIAGLVAGVFMSWDVIKMSRPTDKDAEQVLSYGVGTFIIMTFFNYVIGTLRSYQSQIQTQSLVITLAAAPFEEALFRLLIATGLFRGFIVIIRPFFKKMKMGGAEEFTIIFVSLLTSYIFLGFHGAVYNIESDFQTITFLFSNSFVYTVIFLWTGNLMVSTTAHLLNNGAAAFLSVLMIPAAASTIALIPSVAIALVMNRDRKYWNK